MAEGRRQTASRAVAPAGRPAGLVPRLGTLLPYMGPAFVASIAYVDPGNFATNIAAGSLFGYDLLWVVLAANLVAILVQSLAARLGIATGQTLPELSRRFLPARLNRFLWVVAELGTMATDLAELMGAALGLRLLFHLPLLAAALLAGASTLLLLKLEERGFRLVEEVIIGFLGVIAVAYVGEVFLARPAWGTLLPHLVVPRLDGEELLYAAGIFGATVMPHVVYLHSALVLPRRTGADPAVLDRYERIDVLVAMNVAFLVNASLLVMAAAAFGARGLEVSGIEEAHRTLRPLFGPAAATVFAVGLLASGLASSMVGTMAGQTILAGFVDVRLGLLERRLLTLLPAVAVVALGFDPVRVLVLSQVVLSFALPFALGPLVFFNADRRVMGERSAPPWLTGLATLVAVAVVALDLLLLAQAAAGLLT